MIKKLFPFLSVIMLALFVGACSSEDVMPDIDQGASSRTVTFEALMPGSGATTRVAAEELADRSIDLKWETGDEIVLLFVQGDVKKSATATVVSADGETGTFTVTLPEGIVGTTDYTLYGAYGTAGAPAEGSTIVDLASTGDLGNKILLHFEKAVTGNAIGSVDFVHKGYLFTAKVEITSGTVTNIGLAADTDWAISSSNYTFDLVSGAFATATAKANSIALENFAVEDGVATARSWFPATEVELPALKLSVNGTAVTTEAKPAKTPVAGEAYYLYAKYDGTDLVFDDKGTKENPFTVAEAFGAQGRSDVWVKGYIVGVKTGQNYGVDFTGVTTTNTNLVITDNKDETDPQKALGVQLPKGTVRNALNLAENTSMYKAEVLLKGDLDAYFGSDEGLKNVDEYEIISTEPFFIADLNELIFQASGDALTQTIEITTLDTETWSVASDVSWLTVAPGSGTGSGSIGVTAQENSAETERTTTVTITPTANADLTPIVVNVTQLGTVAPPAELLFPGSDFNDWATFTSSLNTYGLKDYATESAAGGRDGSGAIHINGTPTGNDFVFTAVVPEGFSAVGRTMIHFWIKGTAAKSLSLNVYTGSGYKPYNLGSATADVVLEPKASNSYTGNVNTNGEWIQVTLDISSIANIISTTAGQDLFAIKVGRDTVYDILVDDITIE